MKFNISYMGPEWIAHLRRDLMLLLKHSLEDLGHQVMLSTRTLEMGWTNIVISAYFLKPEDMKRMAESGAEIIHLNTEVIKDDLLNFNPEKVDFMGAYLPFLQSGIGVLDLLPDNMPEHERYGNKAHFLRLAYHEKLEEIQHFSPADKDLDFYIFGMMTERRQSFVNALQQAGYRGAVHHTCPYWERNSFIERAKVNLNVMQADIYSHVSALRISYLSNNHCAILSERENDPAGFLDGVKITDPEHFLTDFASLIESNNYRKLGDESFYHYRQQHMTPIMEEALEAMLGEGMGRV